MATIQVAIVTLHINFLQGYYLFEKFFSLLVFIRFF